MLFPISENTTLCPAIAIAEILTYLVATMKRRAFLKGSAIVGASLVLPRLATATSGMFSSPTERRIAQVLDARRTMVQNVPVLRSFGGGKLDLVSPFVMLDEFGPLQIDPGTLGMNIQAHPHAGVTPTTYLLSGSGRHTDSMANDIVYEKGEFMTFSSGRGAIHEEVSSLDIRREGGVVHGFQIWLNVPGAEKFSEPVTHIHNRSHLPEFESEDFRLKVVMGSAFGKTSPVFTYTPAFYYHVELRSGGRLDLPVDPNHNAFVHVIEGEVETENRTVLTDAQLGLFNRGGEVMRFFAPTAPATFLVLGGQPLNEPVVSYGPFVMNTQAQIEACFRNYRSGKMGEL